MSLTDPRVVYANEGVLRCEAPAPCNSQVVTIAGTPIDDLLNGTSGRDVISTGEGEDSVNALGGRDLVCGADANDEIRLGRGRDRRFGDGGNDTILGGRGRDRTDGGPGTDTCTAERETACE